MDTHSLRRWISRGIIAAGIVWVVLALANDKESLLVSFAVESYAWLGFTIVAGCIAQLLMVPIFRSLLTVHAESRQSLGLVARLFFVAQLLRHLPGRIWGVVFLVNEALDEIPATAMVRTNIDFMFLSTAFNLVTAGFLFVAVMSGVGSALLFAFVSVGGLAYALRSNLLGRVGERFAPNLPSRLRSLIERSGARARISWDTTIRVIAYFVLVWISFTSVWWALPDVLSSLGDVNIWLLCAAYSVAWVVGYLAFITPAGLGVREAGFFAIASPLMGLTELTVLAVFLRIWQILVESPMFMAFVFVKPQAENARALVRQSNPGQDAEPRNLGAIENSKPEG